MKTIPSNHLYNGIKIIKNMASNPAQNKGFMLMVKAKRMLRISSCLNNQPNIYMQTITVGERGNQKMRN